LLDKSQFFDGLFAISHEFTPDINSNCINVKNGAVISFKTRTAAHGSFSPKDLIGQNISREYPYRYFAADNQLPVVLGLDISTTAIYITLCNYKFIKF